MSNQGLRQASVRAVTGTVGSYNDDWHALFTGAGIAAGDFNGRMIAWINDRLGTSYSNINDAMQAFAINQGFPDWNSMGTFDAGGFEGILDTLSTSAAGAWSVARRLTADYEGSLIRGRHSGGTEADIGYDSDGLLDESVLTALAAGGNVSEVTRYDQSGNARNLTQGTAAKQPGLVASGTINKKNSKPVADFVNASAQVLAITGLTTITTDKLTVITVLSMDNATANFGHAVSFNKTGEADWNSNNGGAPIERVSTNQQIYAASNNRKPPALNTTYGTLQRFTTIWNGSTVTIYSDTASPGTPTASTGNFNINEIRIGDGAGGGFAWDGAIAECIIFTDTLSAPDLAALEADVDAFYGL